MSKKSLGSREVRSIICKAANMRSNAQLWVNFFVNPTDLSRRIVAVATYPFTRNDYVQACLLGSPLSTTSDAMMQSIRFKLFGSNTKAGISCSLCAQDAVVKLVVCCSQCRKDQKEKEEKEEEYSE